MNKQQSCPLQIGDMVVAGRDRIRTSLRVTAIDASTIVFETLEGFPRSMRTVDMTTSRLLIEHRVWAVLRSNKAKAKYLLRS